MPLKTCFLFKVLCPCDVEFTRSVDPVAHSGVQMEAKLSDINLYASMRTIHIIMDVVDKLSSWENVRLYIKTNNHSPRLLLAQSYMIDYLSGCIVKLLP